MDYRARIIEELNAKIEVEKNSTIKEDLIILTRVLEKEGLYKAALHDFINLKGTSIPLLELYEIPEIHQAFIDAIINPRLSRETNPEQYLDIVDVLTRAIPVEILIVDKDIQSLIPNITYEQAKKLFSGPETILLLDDEKIYNTIIAKAKQDERFYAAIDYNDRSMADGTAALIFKNDIGGSKLINETPERQLKIVESTLEGTQAESFIRNINRYKPEVVKAIIENKILIEQLIVIQSENKTQDSLIPTEYEADIVAKHLNFLKELSYDQKLNFIYKMRNPEMQKYLIQTLNITKNLVSQDDFYSFFIGIKDDDYLVEIFCDLEILKAIGRYKFRFVIPKFSEELQRKIFNNPIFQEYIRKHVYYDDIIAIISTFNVSIIDEFLPLLKKVNALDYLNLFKETKNKKYIQNIIDELNKLKEEKSEEYDDFLNYISNSLIANDYAAMLTEEQFEFFITSSKKVEDKEKALGNLDRSSLPAQVQEKDKVLLESMDRNNPKTQEEINALTAYRLNLKHENTIAASIAIIAKEDSRVINRIGYEIINRVSKEDRKILLDRMTIPGLITHLPASRYIIEYVYDLYQKQPELFPNVKLSSEDRVVHSDENLEEEATKKLIELFFILPKNIQESLLNSNFIQHEEIKEYVRKKVLSVPNYFTGGCYKKIEKTFTPEELKTILESLTVQNIVSYYGTISIGFSLFGKDKYEEVRDEVLLQRRNEIIHELNLNHNNLLFRMRLGTIVGEIYKVVSDKKELLLSLEPNILLDTYTQHPYSDTDKLKNQYILDILKEQPEVLTNAKEDKIKRMLTTLPKKDLEYLLSNFNTSNLITLLSKTKNKDTEETLMNKFNENPYFINQTNQSLEEILNRLEEQNKTTIYTTIDEQFESLELPYGIKDKLKKLSYDEKIFLIYGVHENIFDDEKYQFIVALLNKDPFALNSLNIELFNDDIFAISKNIIPKIYRYEELTINYIKLIKSSNIRSKILLKLIEHLNEYTTNETVYIQKLDAIVQYLTKRTDTTIDRYNINNVNAEELHELEEYILSDSVDYLIETSNIHGIFTLADRGNKENQNTAKEIEQRRELELDAMMDTIEDFKKAKDIFFKRYFKIDTDQAELVLNKYKTSLDSIASYIKNPNVLKLLSDINIVLNIKTLDELKSLYYSVSTKYNVEDFLYMFDELNKAYNLSIANDLKGYKNGKEKPLALIVDDETVIVNAIELDSDFDMFVHSTDAYGSMEMINDNYFDSWNYSDKTSNHGICASYISNSNLGTARVRGKGVMFGFVNLNQNSISSLAPYDLVSHNDGIVTTSKRPPMYTDTKTLADYTRHTHNEAVLERRNVTEDSLYPVIQPDCIIIFEEMTDEIKQNAIHAQRDFKEQGIDLPIIYINKRKVIELEAQRLKEMISNCEKKPNLELLAAIINKYESNRCGLDFEENLNVEELFQKDKIYELIISTLRQVKEVANKDDIIKFINIIEHEQHKFKLIEENVGERAHKFDLLDENLIIELDILKRQYLQDPTSFDSKITI